jgi:hypothetical protein
MGEWGNEIKVHMKEIRLEGLDWIDLACDRDMWRALVNTSKCAFHFHGMWGM